MFDSPKFEVDLKSLIKEGDLDTIKYIPDLTYHISTPTEDGINFFHFACLKGQYKIAKYFKHINKYIHQITDKYGNNAAFYAALSNSHGGKKILNLFLKKYSNEYILHENNYGLTLVHISFHRNLFKTIRFLRSKGLATLTFDKNNPIHQKISIDIANNYFDLANKLILQQKYNDFHDLEHLIYLKTNDIQNEVHYNLINEIVLKIKDKINSIVEIVNNYEKQKSEIKKNSKNVQLKCIDPIIEHLNQGHEDIKRIFDLEAINKIFEEPMKELTKKDFDDFKETIDEYKQKIEDMLVYFKDQKAEIISHEQK